MKSPRTTTKTWHGQKNKENFLKKSFMAMDVKKHSLTHMVTQKWCKL